MHVAFLVLGGRIIKEDQVCPFIGFVLNGRDAGYIHLGGFIRVGTGQQWIAGVIITTMGWVVQAKGGDTDCLAGHILNREPGSQQQ